MSIAIHTHRTGRMPYRFVAFRPEERVASSRRERLQTGRALMRHFVLAFVATGAVLSGVVAAGLPL